MQCNLTRHNASLRQASQLKDLRQFRVGDRTTAPESGHSELCRATPAFGQHRPIVRVRVEVIPRDHAKAVFRLSIGERLLSQERTVSRRVLTGGYEQLSGADRARLVYLRGALSRLVAL
jgi:hypothetical protein